MTTRAGRRRGRQADAGTRTTRGCAWGLLQATCARCRRRGTCWPHDVSGTPTSGGYDQGGVGPAGKPLSSATTAGPTARICLETLCVRQAARPRIGAGGEQIKNPDSTTRRNLCEFGPGDGSGGPNLALNSVLPADHVATDLTPETQRQNARKPNNEAPPGLNPPLRARIQS